jgi:hypothetical protein
VRPGRASPCGGLAILAAADPRLGEGVTAVAAFAPFASLRSMLRLATTSWYGDAPYPANPLVASAATRSLRASAPSDPAVRALLENADPLRFDGLFAELAPETQELVRLLSPVERIGAVAAPVELVSAPFDAYCPAAETRALARAGRDVRVTTTRALEHVRPRHHPGVVRVVALLDRVLRHAVAAEPETGLRPAVAR